MGCDSAKNCDLKMDLSVFLLCTRKEKILLNKQAKITIE